LINDPFHFENDPSKMEGFFIYAIAASVFNNFLKHYKAGGFQRHLTSQ